VVHVPFRVYNPKYKIIDIRIINPINIWVNNSASVFIWKKGYSNSCALSTTLVIAISTVAAGLGFNIARDMKKFVHISKILLLFNKIEI